MHLCKRTVMVCGLGQLGSVFSAGLLKAGYPVFPWLRGSEWDDDKQLAQNMNPIWVCVGEQDLEQWLQKIPKAEIPRCIFVQNGLFVSDIKRLQISEATFVQVWFSKKKGTGIDVCGRSVAVGHQASHVQEIFEKLELPLEIQAIENLPRATAVKHAFILAFNLLSVVGQKLLGLTSKTVSWYASEQRDLFLRVIDCAIWLAEQKTMTQLDVGDKAIVSNGLLALGHLPAGGRSAQRRVEEAFSDLDRASILPGFQDFMPNVSTQNRSDPIEI